MKTAVFLKFGNGLYLQPMLILILASVALVSCSSNYASSLGANPANVPVTFSVQDTPPAGVAIVSFEVQISNATIHNSGTNADVPLVVKPMEVELEHLQSEPALLGSLNVPAGTYSSITATFANPQMEIFNNTAAPITVGTTVCAVKTACKLMPALNPATTTISTAPFPITLAANSPIGFLLHFDVNSSVSTDLSTITPTIDLKELAPTAGAVIQEHMAGTITSLNSPDFTLQPGIGVPMPVSAMLPPVVQIVTDANTVYRFADFLAASPCTMNSFACLAVGQTVLVAVNVQSDGSLHAVSVTLFEQFNPAMEGTVVSVTPAQNQFQITMLGGQWMPGGPAIITATVGAVATVTVNSSTAYQIDWDGITPPSGLTFAGIGDITVGQVVEVQPPPVVSPVANAFSISTNRVRLEESQITATVSATNPSGTPPSFTLSSLPPIFPSGSSANVLTTPTTFFSFNITGGVAGLAKADIVSVGGLLFNTPTGPTVVAERVLKRVPCMATSGSGTTTPVPCVTQD